MTQLTVMSSDQMGPLEVSVYGPADETFEFVLSSGKTEHSVPVNPGLYAVVARRPSGARLRQSVEVKDLDATVYLFQLVGSSPNEFMWNETLRGSVMRDSGAALDAPWRSRLGDTGETVLRGALSSTLSPFSLKLPQAGSLVDAIGGRADERLWERVQPASLTLRLWSLGERGWEDGAVDAAALAPQADVSSEFLKVIIRPRKQPLALGLLNDRGIGPIVNLPPFADGIEVSFLSRSLSSGASDRSHSVGGLRVPVAVLGLLNHAAQDLIAALAEPATPPAEQLWTQSAERLSPVQGPWTMLIDKFARPAEALLAAHYLLRFLPGQLPVEWADNLCRALPVAMDGPVIAAWARLHNRASGISDACFNSKFRELIERAISRPVTLFARSRALLFEALRLISDPSSLIEQTNETAYRRFGAEAGGLESFWGGDPTLPGESSEAPSGKVLAEVSLNDGAFEGMAAGRGMCLPRSAGNA